MAALRTASLPLACVPAIYVSQIEKKGVDARPFATPKGLLPRRRVKPGHDEFGKLPHDSDPIGEPAVARAIGQPLDRRVAAEAEVLRARRRDRPTAGLLAQFEQRAGVAVMDRLRFDVRLRLQWHHFDEKLPQPRTRLRPRRRVLLSKSLRAALVAGQVEAGDFADNGIAAYADVGRDFAAR